MRATNTFQALGLGALLGLTGCISVHHDYDGDYAPPVYGERYGDDGVQRVYDVNLGVYTVVGYPDTYWHDGWYWRHAHGYWERCARPRGHWSRADWDYVPYRLRPRYGDYPGDRWDRREERHDRHFDRRQERADRRDQNWHDRSERVETRRDRHEENADLRHDQHNERQADRHVVGDGRHDRRDERWQEHEARAEQRHDQRDERQELKRDRRSAQQLGRHEQRTERRDERRDRREERHDRRHGVDEQYAREGLE